jgi:hypothetical protein
MGISAVGETFNVCRSGQIVCPAIIPIRDDPKVVVPVDVSDGLGFKGMAPGGDRVSTRNRFPL